MDKAYDISITYPGNNLCCLLSYIHSMSISIEIPVKIIDILGCEYTILYIQKKHINGCTAK